MGKYI